MAKGQKKTGREDRKPKQNVEPKQNASKPSLKGKPADGVPKQN